MGATGLVLLMALSLSRHYESPAPLLLFCLGIITTTWVRLVVFAITARTDINVFRYAPFSNSNLFRSHRAGVTTGV